MWPFRRKSRAPEAVTWAEPERSPARPQPAWDEADPDPASTPMSDEEADAFLREQDRILDELDAEVERLIARSSPDRAPVEIMLCPACGVYGEQLLDRDGFPAECRSCGWEGGAV